jgi:L-rhamnose-H+ transport protein
MSLLNGIFFHSVGAAGASLCYTPEKKVKSWSWQTYWLAQAAICWLVLPIFVAWITIPDLAIVLQEAPKAAMLSSFVYGMLYGIGGTAFGMSIRYVGYSLTYAIAVGISCVVGTLLPPIMNGTLSTTLQGVGANYIISGIAMGALGIVVCGIAGRKKEKLMETEGGKSSSHFSFAKGLPLCILAGILSAFYGFAIAEGAPIVEVAAAHGAADFKTNVVYIFSNTGAFVTTLLYCLYLHIKENTLTEYIKVPKSLGTNYLMAIITGVLWYFQFFFYGLGHVNLGKYEFSSWAIHMILLVLFSVLTGVVLKEWKMCTRSILQILVLAITILIAAVLLLTFGNYLGISKV